MKNIAIFASGSGTNAENIIKHFRNHPTIHVAAVLCNNPDAYVLQRAKNLNVPTLLFNKGQLRDTTLIDSYLAELDVQYLVLAGFLLLLPPRITATYGDRIVNIHPSLLPKFGGKGMYGHHVHQAVIDAHETVSGITIHRVNNLYDDGQILTQKTCQVLPTDTPDTLAAKIHQLEQTWFPTIIETDINHLLP